MREPSGSSPFRSVVLDVDSTLSGIEGIDWLAALRGPDLAARIGELTREAMDGTTPIDRLYGRRLELVRPTRAELGELARAYATSAAPGARDTIDRMRRAGLEVRVISGGIRGAILPFAAWLGLSPEAVRAVEVRTDPEGRYMDWDEASPLATPTGKEVVLRSLGLPMPVLAVGDGSTDLAMRAAGATFAAFTGFVRRDAVVRAADHAVSSFDELRSLVLP
ncbi:MAG: HAD-IB family phosphatase [Gemmatimonadetes bacterium]|nr:HAD-IB family phosphatase [Gemmatimonadota bacterium]